MIAADAVDEFFADVRAPQTTARTAAKHTTADQQRIRTHTPAAAHPSMRAGNEQTNKQTGDRLAVHELRADVLGVGRKGVSGGARARVRAFLWVCVPRIGRK
jgi:hypothetical protein